MKKNKYSALVKIMLAYFAFLLLGFIIGKAGEKQSLNIESVKNIDVIHAFLIILGRNTLAFIILLTSVILGKKMVYFFYGINGYIIGLTIAKFKSLLFLITILPHGILEMGSFIATGYYLIRFIEELDSKFIKYACISYTGVFVAVFIESFITPKLTLLLFSN